MRQQANGDQAPPESKNVTQAKAFIEEHHQSLSGAIDHLLYRILFEPELLRSEETVLAYKILYHFRRELLPAPDMDF